VLPTHVVNPCCPRTWYTRATHAPFFNRQPQQEPHVAPIHASSMVINTQDVDLAILGHSNRTEKPMNLSIRLRPAALFFYGFLFPLCLIVGNWGRKTINDHLPIILAITEASIFGAIYMICFMVVVFSPLSPAVLPKYTVTTDTSISASPNSYYYAISTDYVPTIPVRYHS
jgi:hypothetical protein